MRQVNMLKSLWKMCVLIFIEVRFGVGFLIFILPGCSVVVWWKGHWIDTVVGDISMWLFNGDIQFFENYD